MFDVFGFMLIPFLLGIAALVVALIFSKKKMRIIIAAINGVIILAMLVIYTIYSIDAGKEEEESYEYVINKGTLLADITYLGNIDGYECVSFGSLFSSDEYVVHEDKVQVSDFCKVYKYVKVYSKRNESFVTGGADSMIMLSNGISAYEADNIQLIKPDYANMWMISFLMGVPILVIIDLVMMIIVLVMRAKAKKSVKAKN
ncbi:MAG: hypothetical protein MJ104_08670 [Lachnospiraceae bacterium]|nr:hypothetical protein [Lachnospiraceae bacterium]